MPKKSDFAKLISQRLKDAASRGDSSKRLNAGELHRDIGGYPGKKHNMPCCCDAMLEAATNTDTIISQPPKGKGASLTIEYRLPR